MHAPKNRNTMRATHGGVIILFYGIVKLICTFIFHKVHSPGLNFWW